MSGSTGWWNGDHLATGVGREGVSLPDPDVRVPLAGGHEEGISGGDEMTPTREEVIRVARECDATTYTNRNYINKTVTSFTPEQLERLAQHFYEAGAAAAREHGFQRRGVLLFNPYSGKPRHPSDIASDPHGILMLDPEQPLYAAKATGEKK